MIATDIDNDPLQYYLDTPPSKGTVEIYDKTIGGYIYTPNKGATGSDSFTYKVFDGTSYSDPAKSGKISVFINAAGSGNIDPSSPTLVAPEQASNNVDSANARFTWQAAVDPDSDSLSYQIAVCADDPTANCSPVDVNNSLAVLSTPTLKAMSAPGIGLFLFGFMTNRRRRNWFKIALAASIALTLFACSNGAEESVSTGGGFKPSAPQLLSYTDTNLQAGKTYYWKVMVSDDSTGHSVSEIRSFVTK